MDDLELIAFLAWLYDRGTLHESQTGTYVAAAEDACFHKELVKGKHHDKSVTEAKQIVYALRGWTP